MQKLNHIYKLHRYLPFDPSHDQIYEEYQTDDGLSLETISIKYLNEIFDDSQPKLIILTGDAGHGKTFICRKILEDCLGYNSKEARKLLLEECNGSVIQHKTLNLKYPFVIFKDFSEFTLDNAPEYLSEAIADTSTCTIISVNEGHFRAILGSSDKENTQKLEDLFYDSFNSGCVTHDDYLYIVNLNYQSVCSDVDKGLVRKALDKWLHRSKWSKCRDCTSKHFCPIVKNYELLTDAEFGERRKHRIEDIFSLAEKLGTVITVREMLMAIAYILTGGLVCENVHKKIARLKEGWQYKYMYYALLFESPPGISKEQFRRIQILSTFALMDPGKISKRHVDDRIINHAELESGHIELIFKERIGNKEVIIDASNSIDDVLGNAINKNERTDESSLTKMIVGMLRRRDFFDCDESEHHLFSHLGFDFADEFFWIISGENDNSKLSIIKNKLISGLHVIQGLRITGDRPSLYLVDPAYSRSASSSAIISNTVPKADIKLMKQSDAWDTSMEHSIAHSVDWSEREIVLAILSGDDSSYKFNINLLMFDTIMRAASGYIPKNYYAHDLRKLKNFLAKLTEKLPRQDINQILVINGISKYTVAIEGDVIEAHKD